MAKNKHTDNAGAENLNAEHIEGEQHTEQASEVQNETQTDASEQVTKEPEAKKSYDLGAPFGIVEMTPSEYADFTKRFLGADATKDVVKSDKEAKKAANDAVASVNAAERQAKVDATIAVAKELGLDELPKGVKQAFVMHKTGNTEVGVNITLNGMSGYFGLYVPKGKGAPAGDAWKSSPEHVAKCEKAKRDVLNAFHILAQAMNAPSEG